MFGSLGELSKALIVAGALCVAVVAMSRSDVATLSAAQAAAGQSSAALAPRALLDN
jgi:hypothetical protein